MSDDSGARQAFLDSLDRLGSGDQFTFACHPQVSCFNECCADLELELSPYDVLRLREALGLSSAELLEQYARFAIETPTGLPRVFLQMNDDASRSCPFVGPDGCSVYGNRPGACRTYPLGRGAQIGEDGQVVVRWVVVREAHCNGFEEGKSWTLEEWIADQGLEEYNSLNDQYLALQSEWKQHVTRPSKDLTGMAILALFRLDDFRNLVYRRAPETLGLDEAGKARIVEDDSARLAFAFDWLRAVLKQLPG